MIITHCRDCKRDFIDGQPTKITHYRTVLIMAGRIQEGLCDECKETEMRVERLNVAREACSCSVDLSEVYDRR